MKTMTMDDFLGSNGGKIFTVTFLKKDGTERVMNCRMGVWKGKVFVPDLKATFSGRAELVDANTLKAKGCLVAGVFCKAQTWRRIGAAAD